MENDNQSAQELQTLYDKCEKNIIGGNEITSALEHDDRTDFSEYNTECGLVGCSPNWLQKLASKKSYILVYGLLGLYETAVATYYIGTITTLEKRFKFPSAMSGILTSSWDVGTMLASLIVAYFGSKGHKTRWVANGILLASISCFLRYLPHFIYGPGEEAILNSAANTSSSIINMCNTTSPILENCSFNSENSITFTILIISLLSLGAGTSPFFTLGAAYLDDNVLKNKFPFLLSIAICLRFLGPTIGFLASSYNLSFYIVPNSEPSFSSDDPRWIGAWYLGWIPLGIVGIIISFFMALFPKILPRAAERRKLTKVEENKNKTKSFKDFKETLWRLAKNPIFMFNTFSSTTSVLGIVGFWLFMPKYVETQFRKTASEANLVSGTIGLVSTAFGMILSGIVISRFKPRPTYLAAWNVFTETLDILIFITFAYLGCYKDDLHGHYNEDKSWNLIEDCNVQCKCSPSIPYTPLCSMDNAQTFYSPCHAGCTNWSNYNGTKLYENCSCIDGGFGSATEGPCYIDCNTDFVIFLTLLCLMEFLSSTGHAGNTIIQYRAVNPEDKSVSIAVTTVIFCAIAFIPGPIFHGMLIDLSCTVWGITCGKTGNCWMYDGKKMRYLINFIAAGFTFLAMLLDIGVFLNVKKLKIYDEGVENVEVKQSKQSFLKKFKLMNDFLVNNS